MQLVLHLVVILSHVAIVTAVDGCHRDRDKDHRPRENCTSAGFSSVPGGFEPTTKVLLFPKNLFTSLSWASFQTFTEIYEIDLTGNKVPEVTPSATAILPSLSVLRLGSNRLKSLSDGSFSACPALTELYLENNSIQSLSDHTFSGLSKLEILDLSSNHISVLPTLMLHPLRAIETLYLEANRITVMPDNWFSQKVEVPYLYLSANPWACSCSLDYLNKYLNDNEMNIYVRDGPIINSDADSVVCDSPQQHRRKPVITLEESDLCDTTNTYSCLLLCVASVACTLAIVARLVIWYMRVYKPLYVKLARRRRGGREGVSLLTFKKNEDKEAAGIGGGGVVALYRSVLYVQTTGGDAGEKEGEGGEEGGNERVLVSLEPTAAGGGATNEEEGERGGREGRGVYRKMLYRLLSKEEEIGGWRDVMEECRISEEDGGKKEAGKDAGMSGGVVSRKRYSVILREEREEAEGGREELDWVVGGWEVKRGGGDGERQEEEQRSSWGEWLAHYLPSMPWGVTTPPEVGATL
ncbi:hypothetical protein Q5P01_002957 [Channa striata]|uniref:LRRCT domain-containing protein n=1 Tax=Channa striata TaxID=64152 RepID=A0AA88NV79_CHASR|nr:hypothetical protein Q5P01_002957 [Channa striata]